MEILTSLFNKNTVLRTCLVISLVILVVCAFAGCNPTTGNTNSDSTSNDTSSVVSLISSNPPEFNDEIDFGSSETESTSSGDAGESSSDAISSTDSEDKPGNVEDQNPTSSNTSSKLDKDEDTMEGWNPWPL